MNEIYKELYAYIQSTSDTDSLIYYYVYKIRRSRLRNLQRAINDADIKIHKISEGKSEVYKNYVRDLFKLAVIDYAQSNNNIIDNDFLAKEKRHKNIIILCFLLVVALIISCLLIFICNSNARYKAEYFYVNNISKSEFIDIKYTSKQNIDKLKEYTGSYMPTVIPRGFNVENVSSNKNALNITYVNCSDNKQKIVFSEYETNQIFGLDNTRIAKKININDETAYLVDNGKYKSLTWYESDIVIKIATYNVNANILNSLSKKVEMLH